jgi:hypothetical protein
MTSSNLIQEILSSQILSALYPSTPKSRPCNYPLISLTHFFSHTDTGLLQFLGLQQGQNIFSPKAFLSILKLDPVILLCGEFQTHPHFQTQTEPVHLHLFLLINFFPYFVLIFIYDPFPNPTPTSYSKSSKIYMASKYHNHSNNRSLIDWKCCSCYFSINP